MFYHYAKEFLMDLRLLTLYRLAVWKSIFEVLECHLPLLDGFDQRYLASAAHFSLTRSTVGD